MYSTFQINISRNTKYADMVGFCKLGHMLNMDSLLIKSIFNDWIEMISRT